MNPFLLSPKERLNEWKIVRNELSTHNEDEQLQIVADYWSQAPLTKLAYDIDAPDTWPTPWEMISAGEWCQNSIAIGMEAMLRLSGWNAERLELRLVNDQKVSQVIFLLLVDGKFALNHEWGRVVKFQEENGWTMHKYQWNGKKYVE